MAPAAVADLGFDTSSGQEIDPLIFPSADADEKLKKLWNLHGPAHAPSYANPELTSLNALLRHCAATYTDKPAYLYPLDDSFVIVSWEAFNRLVLKASAHYEAIFRSDIEIGNASGKQPTLAMLGNGTTFEYWLTLLALLRLNLRILVLSDKNAVVAHRHLLKACDVVGLVFDAPEAGILGKEEGFTQVPIPLVSVPEIEAREDVQDSDISKFTASDDWNLQTMIIHSSGSTGMPKPIIHTNRSLCMIAKNYRLLPEFYIEHWYICAPLFHVGGLSTAMGGLPNGMPASFPPRQWPPAPSAIFKAWAKLTEIGMPIDCAQIPPSQVVDMYEYISATTKDFSPFTNLKVVQSGGAAFPPKTMTKLTDLGVNMKTTWGQTEIAGPMRTIPHSRDNPNYYHMRNLWSDTPYVKMESLGDGTYECVVYKGFPLAAELWLKEDSPNPYRTNDVFIEDPPGSGFWVLLGRKDDVVVHSNGEKTQAGTVQTALEDSDPMIYKAAVFGTNRPCTACVLELTAEAHSIGTPEEIEEKVWQAVQKANVTVPKQSQLVRSMVLILAPGEQLPLTPKGNVRRKSAWETYEEKVEEMWERYLAGGQDEQPSAGDDLPDEEFVRSAIAEVCGVPTDQVLPTTSFYDFGLDSQRAVRLRSKLVKRFGQFPMTFIFENPTLESLLVYLTESKDVPVDTTQNARLQWMTDAVNKYSRAIDEWKSTRPRPKESGKQGGEIVYLTGASGGLGNALLEVFVKDSRVSKVYCAVRGKDPKGKVVESLKVRGYAPDIYESEKLFGVTYDMKDEQLGLEPQVYEELSSQVTIVVHNAWRLDFNQPVELFEPDCLKGTMDLLSFCYSGSAKTFSFMSSVSTVMGSAFKGQAKILEAPIENDPLSPTNTGYAQSKYIVERVTQHYASVLSMPVRLLRVGQLCGHSMLGVWNTTEMWPILIETGLDHLHAMPTLSSKAINWLAVDICAQSAARVLMDESLPEYTVTNLTNPNLVSWTALVDMIAEASGKTFERVTMGEWVARLEKLAVGERADVPGLKLLGFFQEMAKNDKGSGNAVEIVSESVLGAEAINTGTVGKWLASWRKDGFVKP